MYETVTAAIAQLDAMSRNLASMQTMLAAVTGGSTAMISVDGNTVALTGPQATSVLNAAITSMMAKAAAAKVKLDAAVTALG